METRKRKEIPAAVVEEALEHRSKIEKGEDTKADAITVTVGDSEQTGPTEDSAVEASVLPESTDAPADATATTAENPDLPPKFPPKPSSPEELAHWNQMFFELMLYRIAHGNVNVKSTDKKHAELYKWIVKLRKDYKTRERDPSDSQLTEDQIRVLESVRFAFTTRGEEHWQKNYEKLKEYKEDHGHVLVPRQCEIPGLGDWVTSQRQQYQEYIKGRPTPLTKQRKELLDAVGFQFRIRNRPEWSSKYDELVEYKEKNGDTRVPQHFKANKALGKWVAKQREQYKLYKKGKHSFLTPDRLEKLASIGFAWTVRGETSSSSSAIKTETEKTEDSASSEVMADGDVADANGDVAKEEKTEEGNKESAKADEGKEVEIQSITV